MSDDQLERLYRTSMAGLLAVVPPWMLLHTMGLADVWMWIAPVEAVLGAVMLIAAHLLLRSAQADRDEHGDDGWGGGWDPPDDDPLPEPVPVGERRKAFELAA